jgi:hypothetical protein
MYFCEVPVSRNLRGVSAITKIKTDEEILDTVNLKLPIFEILETRHIKKCTRNNET